MKFELIVELPDAEGDDSSAFWRICSVPNILRLVIGACRAGCVRVVLRGPERAVSRALELLQGDERTAELEAIREEAWQRGEHVVLEVRANVAVPVPVWKALAEHETPSFVPGAPMLWKQEEDGSAPRTPLWAHGDDAPSGAWVVPLQGRRDTRHARMHIFENITKSTSGPVSRYVNSRFSKPLSRLLVETPMTPNQMTFANTVIGIIAAVFYGLGSFAAVAIGGLLMQLGSALDRCDGELARSKYMESERGAWMDSVGDNITYVAFVIGLSVGYTRFVADTDVIWAEYSLWLGLGAVALTVLLIAGMFLYVHLNRLGGTMTAISHDFRAHVDDGKAGILFRVLDRLKVLGERDQFSLILMAFSLMPWLAQSAAWYHALFFTVFGFIGLASIYFLLGALKARVAMRAAQR